MAVGFARLFDAEEHQLSEIFDLQWGNPIIRSYFGPRDIKQAKSMMKLQLWRFFSYPSELHDAENDDSSDDDRNE
jgi:hypothetical protein